MSELCHPRSLAVTQQIAFERELVQRRIDGVAETEICCASVREPGSWLPDRSLPHSMASRKAR
jgi:hypothetical protein